jgi:hypothetical protein
MTTYPYQNFDIDDPLGILAEQGKGRFLDMAAMNWFRNRSVSPINLLQTWVGWSDYVRLDDVVFLPRGTFEFSRYKKDYPAESALTFACWDALGDPQDVCAWQPATGKTATWFGRAALLGEDNLYAPQVDGGLQVHRHALDWFRAKRYGVVILDHQRAAPILRNAGTLIAASTEHGQKLQKILDVPLPRILVPKPTVTA